MKLLVATDAHLFVLPNKTYWCDSVESYSFWTRYLDVFENVRIVARVKHIDKINEYYTRADGINVEVWEIPDFKGPKQLLNKYLNIHKALRGCFSECECALYRMPSQTAQMTLSHMENKLPYAGEVVYCPKDSITESRFSINKMLNSIVSKQLKEFCKSANGVSYVTKHSIQKYYPSYAQLHGEDEEHFQSFYSSITLEDEAFTGPRDYLNTYKFTFAISDASMNGDRKGESVFLKIIQKVKINGYNISAIIMGDGSQRKYFEQIAADLGLSQLVTFTGQITSSEEVRDYLKKADIFLLPTKGEGLPRAIIEAMALGMPVLSTSVGGIPELLDDEFLFDPQDVHGFSKKICELLEHKEKLNQMSIKNFYKSLEFSNNVLQKKRNIFYSKLRNLAEKRLFT